MTLTQCAGKGDGERSYHGSVSCNWYWFNGIFLLPTNRHGNTMPKLSSPTLSIFSALNSVESSNVKPIVFSAKKEDLLNMAHDVASSQLSLDDPKVLSELSYQLSFIEEVIAWYSTFKCDGGNVAEQSALFASGCSAVGFFSSSSILLSGAKSTGMSMKELLNAGSGTLTWYGAGFFFHFALLMTSFYVRDELRMDQQWLAQLLLCYRSSLYV